jgi:nitrite reductase (NADH) large subunit
LSDIVIIGTGIGGFTVAQKIREADKEANIFLIGKEDFYPYNRIQLSKSLDKDMTEEELLIKPKEWYGENDIKLYKGVEATHISTKDKSVSLSNGETLKYDKLVLANGAKNFRPPIDGIEKEGVFSLRTLDDSWKIRDYMKDVKNVLIIGGGVLGLENAYSLATQGKSVTVVERNKWLMPRQLDRYASNLLEKKLEAENIDILFEDAVEKITGKDKVEGYIDSHGKEHPAEMVIFSTGITPNTDIEIDTDLEHNKGIVVTTNMKTNIEDIYAVGDICECEGINYGLWNISKQQGIVAAKNILGESSEFVSGSSMMSLNSFGISLFSLGDISEDGADYVLKEESENYRKLIVKNDKISGAIVFNDAKKALAIKKLLEKRETVSKEEAEKLIK